jgi:hypothetical protein
MGIHFQIGQSKITVDIDKTKDFYSTLPKISENCKCDDCKYFEDVLTKKDIRLFVILKSMGVDPGRQPNIGSDGICSVGPTDNYNKAYFGYYNLFGQLSKANRKIQTENIDEELESVDFIEHSFDNKVNYSIKQIKGDELTVEFYIEYEKIAH